MFNAQEKLLIVFISRQYFPLLLGWVLLMYSLIICFQQEQSSVSSWTQSTSLFCFCCLCVMITSRLGPLAELLSVALWDLPLFTGIPHWCNCSRNSPFFFSFFFCFTSIFFFLNCSNTCELVQCLFSTSGTLYL